MQRKNITAALAVLVITGSLSAADSPQVQALKQQIKTLREQREAAAKAIHAQYDAAINQAKMSEAQLHATRKELATQESQLNALSSSPASKEMQANMESLRAAFKGDIKLDAAQINALRAQRTNHVDAIRAAYDAQIRQLEAAIKAAPKANSKSSSPPKENPSTTKKK
jgi:hypothetical protein